MGVVTLETEGSQGRMAPNPRFATARNILALILREMSSRYGRTPGGYIWSVVEPLAAILILSIGFSLLLRAPSLGISFVLFYTTGYLPLTFYNAISQPVAQSINFSKPLLRFPAVGWIDAILARLILNTLTNLIVGALLIVVVLNLVENRAVLDLSPIVLSALLCILLGFAVGAVNCCLFGLFPAWQMVWGILNRPLILASGVIFIYEDLPRFLQDILWFNPLLHITGLLRTWFYPTYSPAYISVDYVVLTSLIVLALGLMLTRRFHRVILNK